MTRSSLVSSSFAFPPLPPPPSSLLLSSAPLFSSLPYFLHPRLTTPHPPPPLPPHLISYLLSLTPEQLESIHSTPSALSKFLSNHAPQPLSNFAASTLKLSSSFPQFPIPPVPTGLSSRRSRSRPRASKRAQLASLRSLLLHVINSSNVPIRRVVDLGAGHGHLAAVLANQLPIPVLALDRDPQFVATARRIYGTLPNLSVEQVTVGEQSVALKCTDLVVGLHACGSLGDHIVQRSVLETVGACVLVSCCLQKRKESYREPLSKLVKNQPILDKALRVEKNTLGVTNWSGGEAGMKGREARYALRLVLEKRGWRGKPGDEAMGISRWKLRKGLREVVHEVLHKERLPPLEIGEAERAEEQAHEEFGQVRRLSLGRMLAGNALEMGIVLDRGAKLEEGGFGTVGCWKMWDERISARNLACVAWR